jgi:hypothetical protein
VPLVITAYHDEYFNYCVTSAQQKLYGIIKTVQINNPRVRFPAGAGNFSPHHRVQNGSGAHPTSYPMGVKGSFPGGKEAGA